MNRKELSNNDNTNKLANKKEKKRKEKTHWHIVKIDIPQYGKIRWSLLWKETSVFLISFKLYILSLKLMFNKASENRISCPMSKKMLWQV